MDWPCGPGAGAGLVTGVGAVFNAVVGKTVGPIGGVVGPIGVGTLVGNTVVCGVGLELGAMVGPIGVG
jgi:hypothetical protein